MKKVLSILAITIITGSLWAATNGETLRSLYDVIAPVIAGNPVAADRQVGQIYFDVTANRFKGINKDGGIDILTNVGSGPAAALPKARVDAPVAASLVYDPVTSFAPVIFSVETYDASNLYNSTTGIFTAPAAGVYTLMSTLQVGSLFSIGDSISMAVLKNGTDLLDAEWTAGAKLECNSLKKI